MNWHITYDMANANALAMSLAADFTQRMRPRL